MVDKNERPALPDGPSQELTSDDEPEHASSTLAQRQPASPSAIQFLEQFRPGGPWVLTAISPDRTSIETKTFHGGQEAAAETWIKENNGKRNIYFMVNPPTHDLPKKAERGDVAALSWLHLDLDPRPGEDLTRERERALRLLQKPPKNIPPPTCIIFSGGGYQGFWRLANSLPIDGDLKKAEDAKLYNLALERIFGADNCHNVDRIMRLPWTMNLPDATKIKKGRVPTEAVLVEFHEDRVYDLSLFAKAPPNHAEAEGPAVTAAPRVQIPDSVDRVNLDKEAGISDRTKAIIVKGHDPDAPKLEDNSRSAWLFDVICNLIREKVPDEKIYAIITDKDFAISESVLDKGTPERIKRYALRQIERGYEFAIHPLLAELNDKHFVVESYGGRCRVAQEIFDPLKRFRLDTQSFDDFRNRYLNREIEIGKNKGGHPITVPLGKWWLGHPMRRQYQRIVFAPEQKVENAYNLWQGFSVTPHPGDWSLLQAHIRENICAGDADNHNWLMGWLANAVQHPGRPGESAPVLRGEEGAGKGILVRNFGALFGRHFMHVSEAEQLAGKFNAHLQDCVVLFADEAFYAGNRQHEMNLKRLITEPTLTIEPKGVNAFQAANCLHIIMASNNAWVVPARHAARRYFVLDVAATRCNDVAYFAAIQRQLDEGGLAAMLHDLQNHDLSGFDTRQPPQTTGLIDQKRRTQEESDPLAAWWLAQLETGELPDEHEWNDDGTLKGSRAEPTLPYWRATRDLLESARRSDGRLRHLGDEQLARFLQSRLVGAGQHRPRLGKERPRGFLFSTLEEHRQRWTQHAGFAGRWSEAATWGGDAGPY